MVKITKGPTYSSKDEYDLKTYLNAQLHQITTSYTHGEHMKLVDVDDVVMTYHSPST